MWTSAPIILSYFFFNDTATTEIYSLSLHDALPISESVQVTASRGLVRTETAALGGVIDNRQITGLPLDGRNFFELDRKSTRLNSSHQIISYAVFCLKKKIMSC